MGLHLHTQHLTQPSPQPRRVDALSAPSQGHRNRAQVDSELRGAVGSQSPAWQPLQCSNKLEDLLEAIQWGGACVAPSLKCLTLDLGSGHDLMGL